MDFCNGKERKRKQVKILNGWDTVRGISILDFMSTESRKQRAFCRGTFCIPNFVFIIHYSLLQYCDTAHIPIHRKNSYSRYSMSLTVGVSDPLQYTILSRLCVWEPPSRREYKPHKTLAIKRHVPRLVHTYLAY